MKVELRSGELRGTLDCGNDVFFVGCRLTDPKRDNRNNIINMNMADDIDEYKTIFNAIDIRMNELCLENGMFLELHCYITDDPSILAIMEPYKGMKMVEVVHGDTELTITV